MRTRKRILDLPQQLNARGWSFSQSTHAVEPLLGDFGGVDAGVGGAYLYAMLRNRSVPVDTVLPHVVYKDLPRALEWLVTTFGFVEHYRYGDPPAGVQVRLGNAWIMLGSAREERRSPSESGTVTQSLTIFVEDVEAHYAKSRGAGAEIVEELHETIYGELQYGVRDLEGHHWLFSRHAHDVDPAAWGAKVVNPL